MGIGQEIQKCGIRRQIKVGTLTRLNKTLMKYLILCLTFFFWGCKSCWSNLYGTNSHEYLNISFPKSKIDGSFLEYYIDSILNKTIVLSDSVKSNFFISDIQDDLNENQRVVHFKTYPEEWYLIGLEINPCWIEAIYNPLISNDAVFDKKWLSENEMSRIKNRFQVEILDQAESYATENNIPDSVVYKK